MFEPVTHVIFDMDGLMIDSESVYDKVIQDIVRQYGKVYSVDVRLKVLGTPEPETARIIIEELQLPLSIEEFLKIYKPLCEKELGNPVILPGVRKLVDHLYSHNVPLAIATSGSQRISDIKTKNHMDIFSKFHHVVYGSSDPEVKNGKPHPDIYLICASRFPDKPAPGKCLVLEDAPNGVKGAISAGMQVVMVPEKSVNEELRKNATLVLNSLLDFQPELFGLPPFEK